MRKVVSTQDMRRIEKVAIQRGVTVEHMIDRAGTAVSDAAAERAHGGRILILVGPGNNGSDGLAAAERLRCAGHGVSVYGFRRDGPGVFEGSMIRSEADVEGAVLRQLLAGATVVVDALLGIGESRPPNGLLSMILQTVGTFPRYEAERIAVDVPTGVNADTGTVAGDVFTADLTLCMGYVKRGVVLLPGRGHSGRILTVDVGIPEDLDDLVKLSVTSVSDIAALLPGRLPDGNKGTYGRLLVIAGSADYVGAPALVTNGAYRAGAGLVEVAVPRSIQPYVAAHTLEAVFKPLEEKEGQIWSESMGLIRESLPRADAVVYGPGIGASHQTQGVTEDMLVAMDEAGVRAAVVDADGLNCLAQMPNWWACKTPLVLTPHPGEMSRLTGCSIDSIQSSRVDMAMRYAARWRKVVVLKGAGTIVASPTGDAVINPTGGPNLSTAGTGDVLSGIIGGLLAQGCSPFDAAIAGTYLHGAAGDLLRERYGDAGTLASDLFTAIPEAHQAALRGSGAHA